MARQLAGTPSTPPTTDIVVTDAIVAAAAPAPVAEVRERYAPDPDAEDLDEGVAGDNRYVTRDDLANFADTIALGVAKGMAANAPRRKVTIGQYDPKTAFLPNRKDAVALTRACFQNGAQLRPINLFVSEIKLLNSITHSGRYIDRIVEVVIVPNGSEDEVHLRYNCKTIDQRMENKGKWRSLQDMLQQIVTAQEAERKDDELNQAIRAERTRR